MRVAVLAVLTATAAMAVGGASASLPGRAGLIAFLGAVDAPLRTVAVDGSAPPRPVTRHLGGDIFGALSPDGRQVAYVTRTALGVAAVDGSADRFLALAAVAIPRWSPDGTWIAYTGSSAPLGSIWLVHPDGSGNRRLGEGSQVVVARRPLLGLDGGQGPHRL